MKANGKQVKLINPREPANFQTLNNVLDTEMKKRTQMGLGVQTRKASITTTEEEEALWEAGVLNTRSGPGILNAISFKIGLHFALRGGAERYNLKTTNFSLVSMIDGTKELRYREDITVPET